MKGANGLVRGRSAKGKGVGKGKQKEKGKRREKGKGERERVLHDDEDDNDGNGDDKASMGHGMALYICWILASARFVLAVLSISKYQNIIINIIIIKRPLKHHT